MLDGQAVFSCLTPISVIGTRAVKTIEGLGTIDKPSPLQAPSSPRTPRSAATAPPACHARPGDPGEEPGRQRR